jgi:membrane-associated phospholipid phosphatase
MLQELVRTVAWWDGSTMEAVQSLRWEPLTLLFLVASMWWVKWPLIALVGACGDARCRRKLPFALVDPGLDPVGTVPGSASFPSGHAATAFAAAVAVGMLYPRFRTPLLALAATVALSRVYLGVHFATDVLAGSVLGAAIGLATGIVVRVQAAPRSLVPSPAPSGTSSTPRRRSPA